MKSGTRVAVAVGAGYLLGRRRRMRMALMLGGAAMASGLGGGMPGQLLRRGTSLLGSADVLGKVSPELGEVTGMISGELLPVGKAAARAAVSSRINALSDRVHERAEALRNPGEEAGEEEEEEEEEEYEPAPEPRRPRARRGGTGGARRASGDGGGRDREDDEAEEDEDVPVRASGRAVRAAGSRAGAPVRRTRR